MNSQFDRAGPGGELVQRTGEVPVESRARDFVDDLHGRTHGRGIGGVGLHEHRRSVSANQPAREVRGEIQNKLHLSASQQATGGFFRLDVIDDCEVAAVFHGVDKPAHEGTVVRGEHRNRQILRIGINRKAEENELDDGNSKHHREGETVAPHLDEFLAQDRDEPDEIEPKHSSSPQRRLWVSPLGCRDFDFHSKLSRASCIKPIKASSRPGSIFSQV